MIRLSSIVRLLCFISIFTISSTQFSSLAKGEEYSDTVPATIFDWVFIGDNGYIYGTPRSLVNIDPQTGFPEFYMPEKYGVLTKSGDVVFDGRKKYVEKVWEKDDRYAVFFEKGKGKGVVDKEFKVIITPQYEYAQVFGDYLAAKKRGQQHISIIDIPTKKIKGKIPGKYQVLGISEQTVITFQENKGSKYLDFNGIPLAAATKAAGNSDLHEFHEGLAMAENPEGGFGFINKAGKKVIPFKYDGEAIFGEWDNSYFHEGLAVVPDIKTGLWGAIDKYGKTVIPFKYSWIRKYENGKALAQTKTPDGIVGWYEIDRNGKITKTFPSGYAPYQLEIDSFLDKESNLYGFQDKEGKLVIPPKFSYALNFEGDLALVRINGIINLIDKKGNILIDNLGIWDITMVPD